MTAPDPTGAPRLFAPATHRFLSPHYDDIALSCGGTVALLARRGAAPEIRVAFGAEPDPARPLSSFAIEQHRRWRLNAHEVIRARRAEESVAAQILGATSTCLTLCDAIYRGGRYRSDAQLFGAVASDEAGLPNQLAGELQAPADARATTRYYAPLGIGQHVDHQLCFETGLRLAAAGWEVWFYEDLPYALQHGARDRRLDQLVATWPESRLEPVARIDVGAVWQAKLSAILAYTSQVPTIFRSVAADGSVAAIDGALRDYALRIGDGILSEQMWRVAEPAPAPASG